MKKKLTSILATIVIALAALTLASCDGVSGSLKQQLATERKARAEAESTASTEAQLRRRWELAAAAVTILAVAGFIAGTALGSRGRRHHESAA